MVLPALAGFSNCGATSPLQAEAMPLPASMTQSKELEQISTLVPKSHPPAYRTDGPSQMSRRPRGTPAHPARRMGWPEPTQRPAQTREWRLDLPEPPVGPLAPLLQ